MDGPGKAHKRVQPGQTTRFKGNWTTEVISFIWDHWWNLWEMWNHDRHGHDLTTRLQAPERQADHKIRQFHEECASKVPQHLEWLFDTTIKTHRSRPTPVTRPWLNMRKPTIKNAMIDNNSDGDPNNPENYPYNTVLETALGIKNPGRGCGFASKSR